MALSEATTPPPAPESVSVRMYRGLLGDCFLLTHTHEGRTYRALIDCGVLQCIGTPQKKPGTAAGAKRMRDVVGNLASDTRGELDLVIATHEHYDHLSGFLLGFETFEHFKIKEVWLAWTENRQDGEAKAIRQNGKKALAALQAIIDGRDAFAVGPEANARLDGIEHLLQFYGEIEPWSPRRPDDLGAAAKPEREPRVPPISCSDVLAWLKTMPKEEKNVRYLEPGQVMAFGVGNRLKANVLGPPRTPGRLAQLNPTAGPQREVYLTSRDDVVAVEATLQFHAARDGGGAVPGVADHPFSMRFRHEQQSRVTKEIAELYDDKDLKTRRIDSEWLGTAEMLALKVDGDVNNTSLALAVEVPWKRHVLLFPADAQVGNWLSWHDQRYPKAPDKPDDPIDTAQDLLGRVILYKVGHHGSHNATARAQGLELMTSPHLVAMIPVVEAVAREQASKNNPDGWAMPYDDLNQRLVEKTRSRILRGDGTPADEAKAFDAGKAIFHLTYADNGPDPLWVELRVDADTA